MEDLFKVLNGYCDIDPAMFSPAAAQIPEEVINLSFSKLNLSLLSDTTSLLTEFLMRRWNSLSSDIVSVSSVSVFTKHLDDFWTQSRYGHIQKLVA